MRQLIRTLALALLAAVICAAPGAAAQPVAYRVDLPLLANGGPRGAMGVEISWWRPDAGLRAIRPGWLRRNALRWADVEPVAGGGYRWDAASVREIEVQLVAAHRLGLRPILVIQGSPAWAVAPYNVDCAPIAREHHAAFARFVAAAVRRYSADPYGVGYWEIGNEPDAFVFSANSGFGCWGQADDPLYGGRAYGELLRAVYPAVKAADPAAQVLNGGLLLDRPYDPLTGEGRSGRFLEGMLAASAGDSFDILAFHSYRYYDGTPDGGETQDWKPGYLRGILASYGVSKPLINSEGALLCPEATEACAQAQAYAVARLHARALRDGLLGFVWYLYDSDGFRNTALLGPIELSAPPRPAHRAFGQSTVALDGQSFQVAVGGLPAGVEAYRFSGGGRATIVIWANTATAAQLALGPGAVPRCAEWDGAALPCVVDAAGNLQIEALPGPRFVVWPER